MRGNMLSGGGQESKRNLPIGVFDSGVGGLTIVKQIHNLLPKESIIYLGDTARVPYGIKSPQTVIRFTQEAISFFMGKGIKLLLIACNTSSSLALPHLKDGYDFPICGVIEPGVEEALKVSRVKRIGVIGTKATIESKVYEIKLKERDPQVKVYSCACPLFVPLVEEGWLKEQITYQVAERYLSDLRGKKIDTLILGCTHYPLIKDVIKYVMGEGVALIDSAEAVVKEVKEILRRKGLESEGGDPHYEFYVTDEPSQFKKLSRLFLEDMVEDVKKIDLEEYKECTRFR